MPRTRSKPKPPAYDRALYQERGRVNHFIRLEGKEWPYPGPTPLQPGCKVRAVVLREFKSDLDKLRQLIQERERLALTEPRF